MRVSIARPLVFLGEYYFYCKDRMEMYIMFRRYRLWYIIAKGDIEIKISKEE